MQNGTGLRRTWACGFILAAAVIAIGVPGGQIEAATAVVSGATLPSPNATATLNMTTLSQTCMGPPPTGPAPLGPTGFGVPAGSTPAPFASFQAQPEGLPPTAAGSTFTVPDTHGAVGPAHVMSILNSRIRVQDKTGLILTDTPLDCFWNTLTGVTWPFDPRVVYDIESNRWFATAASEPRLANASVLLAVSDGADPTQGWKLFRWQSDGADQTWVDFPQIAVSKKWVVLTARIFLVNPKPNTSSDKGNRMWVMDKSSVLGTGLPVGRDFAANFDSGIEAVGPGFLAPAMPLVPTGHGPLEFESDVYLVDQPAGNGYQISPGQQQYRISVISGPMTPTWRRLQATPGCTGLVTAPTQFVAQGAGLPSAPQPQPPAPATAPPIATNDIRIMSAVKRGDRLWFTHHAGLNSTQGGPVDRVSVFWCEFDVSASAFVQSGTIDGQAGVFSTFPSIAVNSRNDVAIGFSRTSATNFADASYAMREGTDPLGVMRPLVQLQAGLAPFNKVSGVRNRWGDYSATVVDPSDGVSFWTIQEYAELPVPTSTPPDQWGTWWGGFRGAKIVYVGPTHTYTQIQPAISNSPPGTLVIVEPGIYPEQLNFMGKNLTVRSTRPRDPATVAATVIDPASGGPAVTFSGTETAAASLEGFTIQNGSGTNGGGIVGNGTGACIIGNTIQNCTASLNGGGIWDCDGPVTGNTVRTNTAVVNGGGLAGCDGVLTYNTVFDNSAVDGGGLYDCDGTIGIGNDVNFNKASNRGAGLHSCDGTVVDALIQNNEAQQDGGGASTCAASFTDCTIDDNKSLMASGGGLHAISGNVVRCTITFNEAQTHGGGLSSCTGDVVDCNASGGVAITDNTADLDGGGLYECSGTIRNNAIFRNSARRNGGGLANCQATVIEDNGITDNSAGTISNPFVGGFGGGLSACNGPIIDNSIVDNNAVTASGGGLANCDGTIEGNTIRQNRAEQFGGGIWGGSGLVRDNMITINTAEIDGGGLSGVVADVIGNKIVTNIAMRNGGGLAVCGGLIQDNTIEDNRALGGFGGGLYACHGTIDDNNIYINFAQSNGGGLAGCTALITNNTIHFNEGKYGGGLHDCDTHILNNTIYGNIARKKGGGINACGGSACQIRNNIVYANTGGAPRQIRNSKNPHNCCIQGWNGGGTKNTKKNPQLSDPANADPALSDFHLTLSPMAVNPCIDKGDDTWRATLDFDGQTRPIDDGGHPNGPRGTTDMGADEF